MGFWRWYVKILIPGWKETAMGWFHFVMHYFSVVRSIKSLLAPYKRLSPVKQKYFSFGSWFNSITFSLISSTIGLVLRVFTIGLGLIFLLITAIVVLVMSVGLVVPFVFIPSYWSWKRVHLKYSAEMSWKKVVKRLMSSQQMRFWLNRTGIEKGRILSCLEENQVPLAIVIQKAKERQKATGRSFISDGDVWLSVAKLIPNVEQELVKAQVDHETNENLVWWYEREIDKLNQIKDFWKEDYLLSLPALGKGWNVGYTNLLDQYASDLTGPKLRWFGFVGREREMEQLIRGLLNQTQPNVLLYSEPGIGRHALVEALANQILWHRVFEFRHYRVVKLDLDKVIAASDHRGGAELLGAILDEAASAGNVILVIEHLEKILSADQGDAGMITAVERGLVGGRLPTVALMDNEDYLMYGASSEIVSKLFQTIELEPLSPKESLQVLMDRVLEVERKQKIYFSAQALDSLVVLAERYLAGPLPEKALDLFEQMISEFRDRPERIEKGDVKKVVAATLHLPIVDVDGDDKKKMLNIETKLAEKIVEQNEAIGKIAKALRRANSGLAGNDKPMASFLFLGPSGVGKTETAKVLAQEFFGSPVLSRVDMSEYSGQDGLERLIGGANSTSVGRLVELVTTHQFGVLLLDEFEKSTSAVHNLFLTIFDEGYFTAGDGRRVDCRNLLIIATSNAGSEFIANRVSGWSSTFQGELIHKLIVERVFSTELLNRFTAVVVYTPLSTEGLRKVTKLLLGKLVKRLKDEQGIKAVFEDALVDEVIARGYKSEFGARSIAHFIEDTVEDKLARKLLEGGVIESVELSV